MIDLLPGITKFEKHLHTKASEEYIRVKFEYENKIWEGWVPIVYRRTGLELITDEEINLHLNKVYNEMNPINYKKWLNEQNEYWSAKPNASVTRSFYEVLKDGDWHCVNCELPNNPNWARRIQDL